MGWTKGHTGGHTHTPCLSLRQGKDTPKHTPTDGDRRKGDPQCPPPPPPPPPSLSRISYPLALTHPPTHPPHQTHKPTTDQTDKMARLIFLLVALLSCCLSTWAFMLPSPLPLRAGASSRVLTLETEVSTFLSLGCMPVWIDE